MAGFDVDFPSLRDARERLRDADARTRAFGTATTTAVDGAGAAIGLGALPGALAGLSEALQKQADRTANVSEELWQALDEAAEEYDATDHRTGADIDAVRFAGHDGPR